MSHIRAAGTAPEIAVRRALRAAGLGYRVNVPDLPGKPDIVLRKYSAVVFVHGCFWHRHAGCPFAYTPKTRTDFWQSKLSANAARDVTEQRALEAMGWHVFVIWECQVRDTQVLSSLVNHIRASEPPASGISARDMNRPTP